MRKWITCKCPRCNKTYKKKLFWVGDGIPLKYCKDCKKSMKYFNTEDGFIYEGYSSLDELSPTSKELESLPQEIDSF